MGKPTNVKIEEAELIFRNFSGVPDKFNPLGKRTTGVKLDTPIAKAMEEDGWNVKWLEPREEGDEPQAYITAEVKYGQYPPKINVLTSGGRTVYGEDLVSLLDSSSFKQVDVILTPYEWEVGDGSGVKAFVDTMYIILEENDLDLKYANWGE